VKYSIYLLTSARIVSIRGDPKWLCSVLSGTFPMLASGPMQNMLDVKRWERGTLVLQVVDKEARCNENIIINQQID